MTTYITTQRKAIDAFANLSLKGMQHHPEAAQQEKHAPTAPTTGLSPAADTANARCLKKSGRTEQAPISAPVRRHAVYSSNLSQDEADALDDRLLWEFLGDKSATKIKRAAFRRMMYRRDHNLLSKRRPKWD
jgi:hypothetical protein